MSNTNDKQAFDLIVIGAGPGGYVCAVRAAQLGMKVACIEKTPTYGGTCLNVGCIPSKAMLESSHHFAMASHEFADHGINVSGLSLDLKKMLARKDEVVKGITGGVAYLFNKHKIRGVQGHGRITGPGRVSVTLTAGGEEQLTAKHIIIATGSAPVEIPPARFDHRFIVDSTDALAFDSVPGHLVVVGGGVIGLELGSVWLRLGAKVTVIEAQDKILGGTDKAVAAALLKMLQKQGMEFHLSTMLEKAVVEGGKVKLSARKGNDMLNLTADKALIAVGRKPYTQGLGLSEIGVGLDRMGRVEVNAHYETAVKGVYAIGDVIVGPMLAHKAEEEGIAVAEMIAGKAGHVNYEAIPSVVYTWPEVASVGLSEEECQQKGLAVRAGRFFFKANGRAKAMGQSDGFVKVLADAKTDRLLGVHIVGPLASEMIAEVAMAFEFGASAEDIARAVHAHPTLAEALKEAALDVDKRAIHS